MRPFKVGDVRDALAELGIEDMTLTEVKGFGRQSGRTEVYRGNEYSLDFVPKAKIEIVVADFIIEVAIAMVTRSAKAGKIGDGKIFVSRIEPGLSEKGRPVAFAI